MTTEELILSTRVADASTPIIAPAERAFQQRERIYIPLNFDEEINRHFLEEDDDDILRWYPMRLRYVKEKKAMEVRYELEKRGYTTFLHAQPRIERRWENQSVPPLFKILFVQAKKVQLKLLKRFDGTCSVMQFWPKSTSDKYRKTEILWVPDAQMTKFIDAATRQDPYGQRIVLTYSDFLDKQDKRVRILTGPFAGVEGEVKRIKHRRIVVALLRETQSALGFCDVLPEDLELL